jgi:4-carboxymuconolactone decarboxylase
LFSTAGKQPREEDGSISEEDKMPRVPLIQNEEADPMIREMFVKMEKNGHRVLNLYRVLAHSPQVGRGFLRMGNAILFKGDLSPTLRELAILRVGNLTQANYEWTQHVAIAKRVGVPQTQIDGISGWVDSREFDERERAVLRYTDEVTQNVRASEAAFQALRRFLSEKEAVELTVVIGYYNMVSRILESLQVELEEDGPFE